MIDFDYQVTNEQLLTAYSALSQQAFNYTLGAVQHAVTPVVDEMLPYLQREPGGVSYPIQWSTEKQRRAFFATKGFGKGIPTRRSHLLSRNYKIVWIGNATDTARLEVQNPATYWRYVKGPEQQRFHQNTGWDDDTVTLIHYADKMWQLIVPAVVEAWSPANVLKMAGIH